MLFLIILLLIITIVLLISKITYNMAFKRDLKTEDIHNIPNGEAYQKSKSSFIQMIDKFDSIPYKDVYITSHDGLKLHAKYYHTQDNAPISICFHGYRATSVRDFCGGVEICFKHGHNVLLIDQRAHGKSEGKTISFGIKERHDCISWINYAKEIHPNSKILLYGISMGAATIIMASELIQDKRIVGIVADSPYSSPTEIIKKVCSEDMHIPSTLAYPFIYLGALIYGHFNLHETSCLSSITKSKIPILIIHGEQDGFVPCEMSKKLHNAASHNVQLVTFPEADHGLSYIVNKQNYENIVNTFLADII